MNKKEQFAKIIVEMRAMNDKLIAEKRGFNEDETKLYAEKETEMRKLQAEIEAEERNQELAGFTTENPDTVNDDESRGVSNEEAEFRDFLKDGKTENRTAMSVGDQGALAPTQFVKEIIKGLDDEAPVYALTRKFGLTSVSGIDAPYMATDASDAAWTTEIPNSAISADSALHYTKKTITPETLVKLVLVSKKLVKTSAIPIDTLVRERLTAKIAKAYENGVLNGTGANQQPLGVFTASNSGVPTSRDVTSTNALNGTCFNCDDLIEMKMALKSGHRKNAVWVMHTDVLKIAMKFKDSDGQYIWQGPVKDNAPGTLLGIPVIESTLAPNTLTAGSYIAVLGDFSKYWWAYVDQMEIQVLLEKYSDTLQIGYQADVLASGAPVLPEAFARLKVGVAA